MVEFYIKLKLILGKPHISIFSTRNVICSFVGVGGGGGFVSCDRRFSVNIMEKFNSYFESLNISESSLQSKKNTENNLIQTPVYTFVTPYLFYTYTFYIIIRIPCIENTQMSRKTRLNYQYFMQKSCFEKRWKF